MTLPIHCVNAASFAPFGDVLEFPPGCTDGFHIVVSEPDHPWRLAVFRYTDKEITRMERHPASRESFEPLEGVTVLLVAQPQSPESPTAFLLDKPICLHKNVWHQTLNLTPEASVKIAENLEVNSEFYDLPVPLSAALCSAVGTGSHEPQKV